MKPLVPASIKFFRLLLFNRNLLFNLLLSVFFSKWTLLCYMIEGESSKTFNKARKFLHQHLEVSSQLLQRMTDLIIDYLVLQVRAGAQVNIICT